MLYFRCINIKLFEKCEASQEFNWIYSNLKNEIVKDLVLAKILQ